MFFILEIETIVRGFKELQIAHEKLQKDHLELKVKFDHLKGKHEKERKKCCNLRSFASLKSNKTVR